MTPIKVSRFIYHKAHPKHRTRILSNGLQPYRGVQWPSNTDIEGDAVFATNSADEKDWFDSTWDDDVWQIDTSKIPNIKWFQDPNFKWGKFKHIYTSDTIPSEAIKLFREGTGKDMLESRQLVKKLLRESLKEKIIGLDYADDEEGLYSDNYVHGQIRIVDNDVEILDWNSNESGHGNTQISLQRLKKAYGGEIRAVDAGYMGEPSFNYWKKMLAKGLIDGIYDDNATLYDRSDLQYMK